MPTVCLLPRAAAWHHPAVVTTGAMGSFTGSIDAVLKTRHKMSLSWLGRWCLGPLLRHAVLLLLLLLDIVDKRFRLFAIDATVPWSVCLSVTFVHCAQTAEDSDTTSFAYDSPYLSQIVLKLAYVGLLEILTQSDLLIWASETFFGKMRPNG